MNRNDRRSENLRLVDTFFFFLKRLVHDLADLMTILVVHTAAGVADVVD